MTVRMPVLQTATPWGHSKWETLEKCPRKFSLRYEYRIAAQGMNRAASLGSAVHRGLALYNWGRRQSNASSDDARKAIMDGSEALDVRTEAVHYVASYIRHYNGDVDEGFDRVVAVEKFFRLRDDRLNFTGRYDLVGAEGKWPIIVDYKTASRMGDPAQEFGLYGQFLGMYESWNRTPKPVLRVSQIVKKNEPEFRIFQINVTAAQAARWRKDLAALHRDLERYTKTGYFPRRYNACVGRYGPCEYLALCTIGPNAAGSYHVPRGTNLTEALR